MWLATFATSSFNNHRRLKKDVGYPTIFSASFIARLQTISCLDCVDNARLVRICGIQVET